MPSLIHAEAGHQVLPHQPLSDRLAVAGMSCREPLIDTEKNGPA